LSKGASLPVRAERFATFGPHLRLFVPVVGLNDLGIE
jgi:hypothetical protein